jgi:hypothetical protein
MGDRLSGRLRPDSGYCRVCNQPGKTIAAIERTRTLMSDSPLPESGNAAMPGNPHVSLSGNASDHKSCVN